MTAVLIGQAFAGHGDVSVDRDRVAVRIPDRDECAARQCAYTGLGVHREQCGGQRAIDGIAAEFGDLTGAVSGELRRGCDGDLGQLLGPPPFPGG